MLSFLLINITHYGFGKNEDVGNIQKILKRTE